MVNAHIPRILIVDSEPKWSRAAKAALEAHRKYLVQNVTDLEAALDTTYGNDFDLILINAALALGEEMSKFKEMVQLYADRVLVITDVSSISTAIKVFKMGADYAEKPFEPKRVIELVTSRLQPTHGTAS